MITLSPAVCITSKLYTCIHVVQYYIIAIFRVRDYIKNGWADNIVDPDASSLQSTRKDTNQGSTADH